MTLWTAIEWVGWSLVVLSILAYPRSVISGAILGYLATSALILLAWNTEQWGMLSLNLLILGMHIFNLFRQLDINSTLKVRSGYCIRCNGGDAFSACTCPQPQIIGRDYDFNS